MIFLWKVCKHNVLPFIPPCFVNNGGSIFYVLIILRIFSLWVNSWEKEEGHSNMFPKHHVQQDGKTNR